MKRKKLKVHQREISIDSQKTEKLRKAETVHQESKAHKIQIQGTYQKNLPVQPEKENIEWIFNLCFFTQLLNTFNYEQK